MFAGTLMLVLSASAVLAAEERLPAATQWNFRGSLAPKAADANPGARQAFELTLWVTKSDAAGGEALWLLEARGHGEWPWTDRFGRIVFDKLGNAEPTGPALLYDRGEAQSVVPLPSLLLATEETLKADATWKDGKLTYHVDQKTQQAGREAWLVSVRDAFGPKRQLTVAADSHLVLAVNERVILGRGDEYALKLELTGSEALDPAAATAIARTGSALLALRGKLNLPPHTQQVQWKPEQIKLLGEQLPEIAKLAASTPLQKQVTAAQRDLALQSGRSDAVAELAGKFFGKNVEPFSLSGLGGDAISQEKLRGQVTILHFWDYRDEPLQEPYGQVGYLDFISHRRKAAGLQVYGVAVDARLADEKTKSAAERGVKKLKAFMNLSYPILLDSGALIKQFGDPRVVGATLPLFVVIGRDGKIAHYHVGHYEVSQDQGLKELDAVVAKALDAK